MLAKFIVLTSTISKKKNARLMWTLNHNYLGFFTFIFTLQKTIIETLQME